MTADLPADQREALIEALASQSVELREVEACDPASAWLTFLVIAGGVMVAAEGVKAVAGAANETIKLAQTINVWRAKCRACAAGLMQPWRRHAGWATGWAKRMC
jgi:hypothetical protein